MYCYIWVLGVSIGGLAGWIGYFWAVVVWQGWIACGWGGLYLGGRPIHLGLNYWKLERRSQRQELDPLVAPFTWGLITGNSRQDIVRLTSIMSPHSLGA